MALLCATVALLLPWALSLWVGDALPVEAATVGRWLCLGVWVNAIGSMYFAWLHAHGRFKATALLHSVELLLYIGFLLFMLMHFGVVGAAMAWTARMTIDSVGLWMLSRSRHNP
jgi:O-antigen/teichoic acid export membrane protein